MEAELAGFTKILPYSTQQPRNGLHELSLQSYFPSSINSPPLAVFVAYSPCVAYFLLTAIPLQATMQSPVEVERDLEADGANAPCQVTTPSETPSETHSSPKVIRSQE